VGATVVSRRPVSALDGLDEAAELARRRLVEAAGANEVQLLLAGVPTALLVAGEGTPMILLHGPGEFAERWSRVLPALAATHRVIAPDLPGHGRSGTHPDGMGGETLMAWLDALVDTCAEPPVLVGHILGGSIVARYAAANRARVSRLVLVDSLGLTKFRPSPRFALGLLGFMAHPTAATHGRFMSQCLLDDAAVRSELGDLWDALRDYSVDRARDPGVKASMKALMREVGVPVIPPEQLGAIGEPTSLIWGRHDRANKIARAESASARFGWPLHVIEDCADDPPIEKPADFVAAVTSTSAAVPRRA
jgi:pimeloyl-ACP methyl ester carboxylesterase